MGHPEVQGPAPKSVSTGQNFPHNCWPLPPLRTQNGAGILLRAGRNAKDHHQAFPGPHSRPRCRAWQSWVGGDRRRQMPPLGASGGDSLPPRPPPSWCHPAQRESPGGLDSDVGPGPCPRFRLSRGGTRGAAATSAPAKMPALDVTTPRDIVLMHVFTPEHSRPTESQSPKAEPDDAQAPRAWAPPWMSGSQSVATRPAVLASPGGMFETQSPRRHPRPAESETPGPGRRPPSGSDAAEV